RLGRASPMRDEVVRPAVVGGHDDRGLVSVGAHAREGRGELAKGAIALAERVEVTSIVVPVRLLIRLTEADEKKARALGGQVSEGDSGGQAIRPKVLRPRPGVGARTFIEERRGLGVVP